MKRIEQIVVIFIAAALAIPSYWFFWTLAGGGGYNKRIKPMSNPKKALNKICDIGNEYNISVTKEEVIEYLSTIDDEATKMWLIKARGGL